MKTRKLQPWKGADMTEAQDSLKELVGETLARREKDPRYRANVARGLDHATEHYAYPWVLRWVDKEKDKTAYLRAAGLAARYPDVPHLAGVTLGTSLRRLSLHRSGKKSLDPTEPDVIAARLASLQEQDLEQAVSTIRRFLDLAGGTGVGFDFFHIAYLLARWGNGFTEASLAIRCRPIGDYYGAWNYDKTIQNNSQEQ